MKNEISRIRAKQEEHRAYVLIKDTPLNLVYLQCLHEFVTQVDTLISFFERDDVLHTGEYLNGIEYMFHFAITLVNSQSDGEMTTKSKIEKDLSRSLISAGMEQLVQVGYFILCHISRNNRFLEIF